MSNTFAKKNKSDPSIRSRGLIYMSLDAFTDWLVNPNKHFTNPPVLDLSYC
jgi:hypothetical protein